MNKESGNSFGYTDIKTFIVYDKEQGNIVHVHQVINLPGALPTGDDHAKIAHDHACTSSGRKAPSLQVLQVETDQIEYGKQYEVDTKKKALRMVGTAPGTSTK